MLLAAKCLEQLKCSLCKRLLSKFPIYVTEGKDNQSLLCGRCEVPASDGKKYLRNGFYERVMENVQFPCINKQNGCMEYLLPKNIEQHELLCQYQIKKCKICEWAGQSFTVLDHYQSKHANLILKNCEFKINIKEDSNISNIILYKETIFSFECNIDQNLKRIKCTLKPLFSTRTNIKHYAQVNLLIDDNIKVSKRFPEINIDENKPKSIGITIEKMLITDAIGIINITNNIKELSFQKQDEEDLIKSKCNGYTSKVKFDINIPTSSNQLLNLTFQPCEYGCGYTTLSASDLKQHYDTSCFNKLYNCLFTYKQNNQLRNCQTLINRKDFPAHITRMHWSDTVTLIKSLPLSIEIGTSASKRSCKCIIDNRDNYFILIIQHVEPHLFLWRVEILNSKNSINNYTFEIVMFNDKTNAKLSLRASCAELTCNKNYNIDDTPCMWLHLDQIKHFINNNRLSFKISVYNGNDILGK